MTLLGLMSVFLHIKMQYNFDILSSEGTHQILFVTPHEP